MSLISFAWPKKSDSQELLSMAYNIGDTDLINRANELRDMEESETSQTRASLNNEDMFSVK